MSARRDGAGPVERRLVEVLEAELRASKARLSAADVATKIETARLNLRAAAQRTGESVEAIAQQTLDRVSRPQAELRLERTFRRMTPEEQCRRYYTDRNTGLFNLRGLEALPPPAGRPLLAEWNVEAMKFINDHHGHEALDSVLRAAACALGQQMPDGARVGGSLRGYVRDQAEAQRIAVAIEKVLDPERRIRVTTAVAPLASTIRETIDRTTAAHNEVTRLERATGRVGYRLGGPVAFMKDAPSIAFEAHMEGVDPKSPVAKQFLEAVAARTGPAISKHRDSRGVEDQALTPAHAQSFARLPAREVAEAIFIEPTTGLLTEDGFRAMAGKKWTASVDLRGLRDLDQALGHAEADKVIAAFGRALAKVTDGRANAARLHGDEYVLQADSKGALTALVETVERECDRMGFYKELPDRQLITVRGVQFAWGIGRDYDQADREDLPRRKALLPEARKPEQVPASRAGRALAELRARGASDVRRELPPREVGLTLTGLDVQARAGQEPKEPSGPER